MKLPAVKSDMMCYTLDDRVLKQMEDHLIFFTIPMESNKFNAGFAVKLYIEKIKLMLHLSLRWLTFTAVENSNLLKFT